MIARVTFANQAGEKSAYMQHTAALKHAAVVQRIAYMSCSTRIPVGSRLGRKREGVQKRGQRRRDEKPSG